MLSVYVRRALDLPPHVAVQKAAQLAVRAIRQRLRRHHDMRASTFVADGPAHLVPRLSIAADDVPGGLVEILPELARRYLDHRFDLLGSGWTQVRYGLSANGLAGVRFAPIPAVPADSGGQWLAAHVPLSNLPDCRRLWRLVEGPYQPIDWQIDFKSGFRWDARRHFRDLSFGAEAGVDVKVPWELARLQHLPQLATAHLLAKAGRPGFEEPAVYAREIRNQIIDFLAANPPRFGVNWLCPMDVGIRAANILLAVDLLRAGGWTPDAPFEQAVARATIAHARHILDHLEWSDTPRSNHYLSDLAGIAFCAAYLPANEETDAWLDFAAHQLGVEIPLQFLPDGGTFECSANYHRLSAELVVFSAALLCRVEEERRAAFARAARRHLHVRPPLGGSETPCWPWSSATWERIGQTIAATSAWTKPDGRFPQIGDTDSGRLFKLHPVIDMHADARENQLDQRGLLAASAALLGRTESPGLSEDHVRFDGVVVRSLAAGTRMVVPAIPGADADSIGDVSDLEALVLEIEALPALAQRKTVIALQGFSPPGLERRAFPHFGLYIFRSASTFLSLRCFAPVGNHGMGHSHDDNLALELFHDGAGLITDPGSYLYTPLPLERNCYRSAAAHFAPRPADREAAEAVAPFEMRHRASGRCLYFGAAGAAVVLEGSDWKAMRVLRLEGEKLVVIDGCSPGQLSPLQSIAVSDGYGLLADRQSICLPAPVAA